MLVQQYKPSKKQVDLSMSWLKKCRSLCSRAWAGFRRFRQSHPLQLFVLSAFLMVLIFQVSIAVNNVWQEKSNRKYVEALPSISLQEFNSLAQEGKLKTIISHDIKTGTLMYPEQRSYLEVVTVDDKKMAWEKSNTSLMNEEFGKMIFQGSTKHDVQFKTGSVIVPNAMSGVLGTVVLLFCILILITFGQKMAAEVLGGHSFKAQKPDFSTNLDDVIGYDEVKKQLRELKDQLLHPDRYQKKGIQAPKGILLTGNPGVGKTMMARAFANELAADFFTCTGADFAEMYVGVGPRRVRSLFHLARQAKVAVIFIDEIDALGSRDTMGNDSERLATLNAMLSEMDGVNMNGQLVVIGATNHAHRLDTALKRPGRFDNTVHIPLPDTSTREGILRHYLKGISVDDSVDLKALALRTNGYSGAELKNVVMEANRLAAREYKNAASHEQDGWVISQEYLHRAQEIALLGVTEAKSHGEDLVRVAIHELGHALAGHLLCQDVVVEKVTVEGRGAALGYAWTRPLNEKKLATQEEMKADLTMILAGRASEEVILGNVSGGAANDIVKANDLARAMVLDYGMGERTKFVRPAIGPDGRPELTSDSQKDVADLLSQAYDAAKALVTVHQDWITQSTSNLMIKGVLYDKELFANLPQPKAPATERDQWVQQMVQTWEARQMQKLH